MKRQQRNCKRYLYLIPIISGILTGISGTFVVKEATAIPTTKADRPVLLSQVPPSSPGASASPLNPRPSIFDEPPYNRRYQRSLPSTPGAVTPPPQIKPLPPTPDAVTPPLPEQQQPPSATVTPVNGIVSVKLINPTNATITYQVVGDTNQRTLLGKSDVTLQNLRIPVTLTFNRQDRGLLNPTAQTTTTGLLEVTLDATTGLSQDRSSMRIQPDGTVFLN